jgi:phosphatidylglycerol---prolipoprotein diacylglyceryl transferase
MNPVLFELPWGGPANAYGTLILIGGLASVPGIWWDAKRRGLGLRRGTVSTASFVVDFGLVLVLGAVLGGRFVHIITMPAAYVDDPARIFALQDTGFVFFGSLLAILAGWLWLARRYGSSFGTLCDLGATWMGLGHAFGRLGCWFAGCCWGAPTQTGLGVEFPAESMAWMHAEVPRTATHTVALHPTQLYEAAGLTTIFVVLAWIRWRRGIEPTWRQASRYAVAYGLLRTITEIFRGDPSRGMLVSLRWPGLSDMLGLVPEQPLGLSISQAVALALVVLGAYGLRRTRAVHAA